MQTTTTIILCGCALLAAAPLPAAAEPEAGQAPAFPATSIYDQASLFWELLEGRKITGLEIRYVGDKTVDEARITHIISSKPGTQFQAKKLDTDVRELVKSGLVDEAQWLAEEAAGGVKLIAEVITPKEFVAMGFRGNMMFSDQELATEAKLPSPGILSESNIVAACRKLETYYQERGYPDTRVVHRVRPSAEADKAELLIEIDEGIKNEIRKMRFEGNHAFPDQELRKEVKTKERGPLQYDQLVLDLNAVLDDYRSKGYLRVKCPGIRVEPVADGRVDLAILIIEGGKYTVAGVSFGELTAFKPEALHPDLSLKANDVYSSTKMRADLTMIRNRYGSGGYADATVSPDIRDEGQDRVTIIYRVNEGSRYRVGRVNLSGNINTADEVIRREIPLIPGDWFNPVELEAAKTRLTSLRLFREVNISGSGSDPGFRDVEVLVEEVSQFDPIGAAIKALGKDWAKTREIVDGIAKSEPEMAASILSGLAVMKEASIRFGLTAMKKQPVDPPLSRVDVAKLSRDMADGEIKDNAEALNNMAWGLATEFENPGKELLEAASYIIKKAVELNREDPAVLDTLARIQFLQGLKDEAVKTLEKAIAKAGDEDLKSQLKLSLESMKKGELPKIKQDEMESGGE